MIRRPPRSPLFPYPPLSRSDGISGCHAFLLIVVVVRGCLRSVGTERLLEPLGPYFRVDLGVDHQRPVAPPEPVFEDRKSTRLNSSHANISYAVFCLKKKHNY